MTVIRKIPFTLTLFLSLFIFSFAIIYSTFSAVSSNFFFLFLISPTPKMMFSCFNELWSKFGAHTLYIAQPFKRDNIHDWQVKTLFIFNKQFLFLVDFVCAFILFQKSMAKKLAFKVEYKINVMKGCCKW